MLTLNVVLTFLKVICCFDSTMFTALNKITILSSNIDYLKYFECFIQLYHFVAIYLFICLFNLHSIILMLFLAVFILCCFFFSFTFIFI